MKLQMLTGTGLMAVLLAVGCSTLQTNYDFDPSANFSTLKTYSFAEKRLPTNIPTQPNEIMDDRIRMALSQALNAKGFTKATAGQGDFVVAFVPASQRVTTTQYVGGWNYSSSFPVTFTEGTLVVNITDPKANKLIWRGSANDAFMSQMNPEAIQKTLNEAATKLFQNFPPKKK